MKKKNDKKKYEDNKWYYLIPLMFIIAVIPLIVYLKVVPLAGDAFNYWTGTKSDYDFFSYYKMVWLLVGSTFTVGALSYRMYKDEGIVKKNYIYYIPMIIYSLFVILSAFFSKNGDVSLYGFVNRYEGMFVLVSYMLVMFASMTLISEEKHIKLIIGALFSSAVVMGIIGVFQYIGYDFYKTDFAKGLMIPYELSDMANKLNFQFKKHVIYASLYHYDYVGSYMAMLMPLTLTIFMLIKNSKAKVAMGLLTLLIAVNWIGCNSRAGILGGIVSIIVILVMLNKYLIKYWKYVAIGVSLVLVISLGLNKISNGYFQTRIMSLVNDMKAITKNTEVDKNASQNIPLKDIVVNGKNASIATQSETLNLILNEEGSICFKDADNKLLPAYTEKDGKVYVLDDRYKEYDIKFAKTEDDKILLCVTKGQIKLYFNIKQNEFELVNNLGNKVDLKPVEKWGFEGKELLGSSRGYIWSRSIPLLKHTIILGYGPDTFTIHFPQNDIKGKMYAYNGDMWQIVDKPHDLYLQIGINTGIISLLAVLMIFGVYLFSSVRIYFNRDYKNLTEISGLGIFTAVIGYLIAAFFNDSVVSVAPVFWVLLGTGIAVNGMVRKNMSVTVTDKK